MKKIIFALTAMILASTANARTLIVYYSFTNNVYRIASDLNTQIETDILRIEPEEEGLDYASNNYALGKALISAIRNNPNNEASYPTIKQVDIDLNQYNTVIVAAPLWWSNMAAPLQTFLFKYGKQMAGKNIGIIVSSASSGITEVVADAKRLIPDGKFIEPHLWIRSSQTSNCHSLISKWLSDIDYTNITSAISAAEDDMGISLITSSNSIEVLGEFDNLYLYNTSGNNILTTKRNFIAVKDTTTGLYIAHISKNGRTITKKIMLHT